MDRIKNVMVSQFTFAKIVGSEASPMGFMSTKQIRNVINGVGQERHWILFDQLEKMDVPQHFLQRRWKSSSVRFKQS
jgi:hypothetical protein